MNIAKRLRALASKTALDGFADELRALATEIESAAPFGYFKAEPFGWTDCQATDKGAVALHEHPASNEWQEAVDEGLMVLHLPCPSDAREAVKALVAAHVRIALDPAVSDAQPKSSGATANGGRPLQRRVGRHERPEATESNL